MSPRLAQGKVDYNLAMDPALLNAGKITAAAEDRKLAELLRFLLRQHIERHGPSEAQDIYQSGAETPHGTRIARFGDMRKLAVEVPVELRQQLEELATFEERPVASVVRRACERYIQAAQVEGAPEE